MSTELIVAIISALVAIASAFIAIYGQRKSSQLESELQRLAKVDERRYESERTAAKFHQPLAQAAYDLQSRFYNIVTHKFFETYVDCGTDRTRDYTINNTTFLIAQYFAWTEIIRTEIQFIDLGKDEETRELAALRDRIYSLWQSNSKPFGTAFSVFAGEQRAIGEALITDGPRGPACIGYGKFLRGLKVNKNQLVEMLHQEISGLDVNEARPRLIALQGALIDLLAFLDPDNIRFPAKNRAKLQ